MGMGGLGELVWRAAELWLTASVTRLVTRRNALLPELLQISGCAAERASVL